MGDASEFNFIQGIKLESPINENYFYQNFLNSAIDSTKIDVIEMKR